MAFICLESHRKEQQEKFDENALSVYLNEKLMHFIASLFEKQKPFPSFEDFKAPGKKSKKFTESEKQKLRDKTKRIKEKFGGGT